MASPLFRASPISGHWFVLVFLSIVHCESCSSMMPHLEIWNVFFSCSLRRRTDTPYRTPHTGHPIQDTPYRTPHTGHPIQDTPYRTPHTGHPIQDRNNGVRQPRSTSILLPTLLKFAQPGALKLEPGFSLSKLWKVLHTPRCNISGEAAGEIWNRSLWGVEGFNLTSLTCSIQSPIILIPD